MKALLIILILLTALILGVAIGVRCHRRLAKKQASPKISELPYIPEDAVLNSLNWGQSSSNEYECFAFDLNRDENSRRLSGRYTDPEGGSRSACESVPLSDGQLKSIENCLRDGTLRGYKERRAGENVCDEADSLLCVGWLLPDGSVISMKYNGMGEKELFELLKSFLMIRFAG